MLEILKRFLQRFSIVSTPSQSKISLLGVLGRSPHEGALPLNPI